MVRITFRIVIIFFILTNCSVKNKKVSSNLKTKYSYQASKLAINGTFFGIDKKGYVNSFTLYENGCYLIGVKSDLNIDNYIELFYNKHKSIDSVGLTKFGNNWLKLKKWNTFSSSWGSYKIKGDTLITYSKGKGGFSKTLQYSRFFLIKSKGKIIHFKTEINGLKRFTRNQLYELKKTKIPHNFCMN